MKVKAKMFEGVTSLQEEAWLTSFKGTDRKGSPYPVIACWETDGAIDETALSEALYALALRHDALRRSFPYLSDNPLKAWVDSEVVVPLRVVEASTSDEETRRDLLLALTTPFDVRATPLWRVVLVRGSEHHSYLGVSADHMICDGISLKVFLNELALAYNAVRAGRPVELGPAAPAYAEFAQRQRDYFAGPWGEERRTFWADYLRTRGKYPPECRLAFPAEARGTGTPPRGRLVTVEVDAEAMHQVAHIRRQWRVTPFALLSSAVLAAMSEILEDTRVGAALDIHGRLLPGAGAGMGLFAHGAPLHVDFAGSGDARARAVAVAETLAEVLKYGLPFRTAGPKWGMDLCQDYGLPVAQLKFNVDQWATSFQLDGVPARLCKLRPPKSERSVQSPGHLDLELTDSPRGLAIEAHFDETLYPPDLVQELLVRSAYGINRLAAL
jgi:hypothetical protein